VKYLMKGWIWNTILTWLSLEMLKFSPTKKPFSKNFFLLGKWRIFENLWNILFITLNGILQIYLFIYFWAEMCRSCLPNTLLNLITHLFYISFRNGYHYCCRVVYIRYSLVTWGSIRCFFFFPILWCSWKWRSSIRWFSQIWLQTRYERIFIKKSFYILGYLLEPTIKIRQIWAIFFFHGKSFVYRLKSLLSHQKLLKFCLEKTLISSNHLVGYLRLSNVIGT